MNETKTSTKEKLIESGANAMLEKSYNAVGLKEILDKAGVPKGSFYHFFKSKEDFGVSIIEHYTDEHLAMIRSILRDKSKSPRERIKAYYEMGRNYYESHKCACSCLVAKLGMEMASLNPPMRAALKSGMDQWRAIFAQCIREGQQEGEIDPSHEPESLADFLFNAWDGAVLRMQVDQDLRSIDEFMEFVFGRILPEPM